MNKIAMFLCLLAVGCAGFETALDNLTSPANTEAYGGAVDRAVAGTPLEPWLAPVGGSAGAIGLVLALLNARRQSKNEAKQSRKRGEQWEAINETKKATDSLMRGQST